MRATVVVLKGNGAKRRICYGKVLKDELWNEKIELNGLHWSLQNWHLRSPTGLLYRATNVSETAPMIEMPLFNEVFIDMNFMRFMKNSQVFHLYWIPAVLVGYERICFKEPYKLSAW